MMQDIEANKAVARQYMQAVEDGDIATLEALQHPDCQWWILGYGDMSRADFIASVTSGLLSAHRRMAQVVGITAEGERVAIEVRGEMHFPDRVYRNEYHNLLVIRDGQIVSGREYMDTRAAAEAFAPEGTGR
ncbi:nuclear transport factor 2 family protein [Sphingobium sp. AntQ-1]|uniref:nuclear transport factor 2 family protein n=1 Tax=Sphingobium sp. AntQ-1 TaxID=2930091 RepID=UPI00234FB24A|nr:nuclear transport factor 2 family protein [Sphingobium sp. AntQ-1]